MEQVYAEFEPYEKMVDALFSPTKQIKYPEIQYFDSFWTTSSIAVGKASAELRSLGFNPMFFYDREHFELGPHPEDPDIPHTHGLSAEEMLSLKDKLNNPCLITISKERETDRGSKYTGLEMTYYDKDNKSFYRMAVLPNTSVKNTFSAGKANLVLTYFQMSNISASLYFKAIDDGKADVVLFDKSKIPTEDLEKFPKTLIDKDSFALSIRGKTDNQVIFTPRENQIQKAIAHEALRRTEDFVDFKEISCSTFQDVDKIISEAKTYTELQLGKRMADALCSLAQDQKMDLQKQLDEKIAEKYCEITMRKKEKIKEGMCRRVETFPVNEEEDIDKMYDFIENEVEPRAPTLERVGLDFDFNGPNVATAKNMSEKLMSEIKSELGEVAYKKEDMFFEKNPELS